MKLQHRVVLLQTMGKPMYYLILAFSLIVYWRGHNEPGGGFIGGLLAVSATLLLANTHGVEEARKRLPLRSHVRLASVGVLCAGASGIAGLLAGHSFMHHLWWDVPMPWGPLALSTVQLFDLGVYLCVWGGIGGYASELLALGDDSSEPAPADDGGLLAAPSACCDFCSCAVADSGSAAGASTPSSSTQGRPA